MSGGVALLVSMRGATVALLLPAFVAIGCGAPTASVSGTVTFKGRPLTSGTVLFHGADGRVEHALIGTDGRYTLADAPLGPVRITVKSHEAAPSGLPSSGGKPPAGPPELASPTRERRDGQYVRLPLRYQSPEESGLSYHVHTGSQTHGIEMTQEAPARR